MIKRALIGQISGIVGRKNAISTQKEMAEFSTDATKIAHMPDVVVFPENSEQVSRILRLATEKGFAVVPRGAGTGMSGGAIPVRGGVVLAMDRLNRILSIDRDNLIARAEPGVITADLQQAAEALGLFYPPDPASLKVSTLGGNIAECAGGLRAVKYGVTRDYVLGLTIVLPTGEIIKTGVETRKGVAGYDLVRLIAGSEGTLAVITAMTLRLVPKPEAKRTMVVFFENVSSAVQTVSKIIRNKIVPSILEFMDRLCIDCVREEIHLDLPENSGAMLLIEVDGNPDLVAHQARIIEDLCGGCHGISGRNGHKKRGRTLGSATKRITLSSQIKAPQNQRRYCGASKQPGGTGIISGNRIPAIWAPHPRLWPCRRWQHSCEHHAGQRRPCSTEKRAHHRQSAFQESH